LKKRGTKQKKNVGPHVRLGNRPNALRRGGEERQGSKSEKSAGKQKTDGAIETGWPKGENLKKRQWQEKKKKIMW